MADADKKAAMAAKRAALEAKRAEIKAKKTAAAEAEDKSDDGVGKNMSKKEALAAKKAKKAELLAKKKAKEGGSVPSGSDEQNTVDPEKSSSKKDDLTAKKAARKAELKARKKGKAGKKVKQPEAEAEPEPEPEPETEYDEIEVDMSYVHANVELEGEEEPRDGPNWQDAEDAIWLDETQGPQAEYNESALVEHIMIISEMNKSHAKKALAERGLDTKGSHEQLLVRLKEAHTREWIEATVKHAQDTAEERDEWEEQQKRLWEEEQRIIEEENLERERARAHMRQINSAFARKAATMKAPALRAELEKRGLDTKGRKAKLLDRLATFLEQEHEHVFGSPEADDQVDEGLTEDASDDEQLSRVEELRRQKAWVREQIKQKRIEKKQEEKDRKLAAKRLEKEMAKVHPDDRDCPPELQRHLVTIRKMNKQHLKKELAVRMLNKNGSHAELLERLVMDEKGVHEASAAEHERETAEERLAREKADKLKWEEELAAVMLENEAKDAAVEHMMKLNEAFAKMKAPQLRSELQLRELSTKGKKADLMERLANYLEEEHSRSFVGLEEKNNKLGIGTENVDSADTESLATQQDEAEKDKDKAVDKKAAKKAELQARRDAKAKSKAEELEASKAAKKKELMEKKKKKKQEASAVGNPPQPEKPTSAKEELQASKAAKKKELMERKKKKQQKDSGEKHVENQETSAGEVVTSVDEAATENTSGSIQPLNETDRKLTKKEKVDAKKAAKKAELMNKRNAKKDKAKDKKRQKKIHPDDQGLDPELQDHLITIRAMSKQHLKLHLNKRGLDAIGTKEELLTQLIAIHKKEFETVPEAESELERQEREQRERKEWEEEQARITEENRVKEEAMAHMMELNENFAVMKKAGLVKELKARGLSTRGKKAQLIERLAQHLEENHVEQFGHLEQEQPIAEDLPAVEQSETEETWKPSELDFDDSGTFRLVNDATKEKRKALAEEEAHQNLVEQERHRILEERLEAEREAEGLPKLTDENKSALNERLKMYEKMSKKHIKYDLEERGLDVTGSRSVLLARLQDDETEQTYHRKTEENEKAAEAQRLALQAEMAEIEAENAEKRRAEEHLRNLGSHYGQLKAPALRQQLKKRGLSTKGKKAVLLERLAVQLEEDMANGVIKPPEEKPTNAFELLMTIEEESKLSEVMEQMQREKEEALAAEEALLNPRSRKQTLAAGAGKLGAKTAKGITKGIAQNSVRVTKSAVGGVIAAQQAAQDSLTEAARDSLAREEYDSDASDEDISMRRRITNKASSITKGAARVALTASKEAAVAGITTTVKGSLGMEGDAGPQIRIREKEGFREYLDERIKNGTFDTGGWSDPAMAHIVENRIVQVEHEFERKLIQDQKKAKLDVKEQIKRQKDWEKSAEGKAQLRMEAAEMAQRQVEEARREAQKQVAEATLVKMALEQQRERERLASLDFEEPPRRMALVLEARKELEKQDGEYSIFTEFQKDPRDPEGEYMEYLCDLEQKTEEEVLDWFRRMRLKHGVVLEVESEPEEEYEQYEYEIDPETGELVRSQDLNQDDESPSGDEEQQKKKQAKKKKKKKKRKVRAHHKDQKENVQLDEGTQDETHDHDWAEEWEDFSDLIPPGPDLELALFKAIDKDGGGELDFDEFKLCVGLAIPDVDAIESAFKKIDTDGGGTLDINEFRRGVDLLLSLAETPDGQPMTKEEMLDMCLSGEDVNPLPTFYCHKMFDFNMSADDHGFMRVTIDGEEIFVPGGSIGAIRPPLEEVTTERVSRRLNKTENIEPVRIRPAMQAAKDVNSAAEKEEFASETRREKGRRQRALEDAEKKRQFDLIVQREQEKQRLVEEEIKSEEQREKDRLDREHEMERMKIYADHDQWKEMVRRRRHHHQGTQAGIRSPYEVLNELRTHCDRYTEEFPFIWDRFVDVLHDLREHVVSDMQRSLQVCKMLPKLADRKRRLQNEMIETLINYEHDISIAKFEGVNVDDEDERTEKIVEVVDGYLQLLGKFERKRFLAMTKEGDLLLARRMATQHLHDYWKEHSRIAAGLYNYCVDLDRQVESSLHSIPRDTIDLFREKMMLELDMCEELTEEEHLLPDPLEPFSDEGRLWAQSDFEDQQLSGHHSDNQYAPDLPGCYWTAVFEGAEGMMMEPEVKKANHDGNGHTGMLNCDDGETYWGRIRRGILELWNRKPPKNMMNMDAMDSAEYYIEREVILLYLYTFVKVPHDNNPHGFLLITGTLHAEEFTCEDEKDLVQWVDSIERGRRWAVDKEELRKFTGGDDNNVAYDEFLEFQKKKQADRAEQLEKVERQFAVDEAPELQKDEEYQQEKRQAAKEKAEKEAELQKLAKKHKKKK